MEDVIFSGSSGRKPVGRAAIELIFDNSDGAVGGQYAGYAEISVKRRLGRDGQSHYLLNSGRCRRRDITDLFLGTGLGPRSYAIIEQGMISRIIEARPEELRNYLEEAAGISRYKERRRDTETRMAHTRENLERLQDLQDELGRQMVTLQRQAKAAARYQTLRAEERCLKAEVLAIRWRDLTGELTNRLSKRDQQQLVLDERSTELRQVEATLEQQRKSQFDLNRDLAEAQKVAYEIGAEIARCEQQLKHAKERKVALSHEYDGLQQQIAELEQHLQTDRGRLAQLLAQSAELSSDLESATETLAKAEAESMALQQQLSGLESQRETLSSRLAEAEKRLHQQEQFQNQQQGECARLATQLDKLRGEQSELERQLGGLDLTAQEQAVAAGEQALVTAEEALGQADKTVRQAHETEQLAQTDHNQLRSELDIATSRLQTLQELQSIALAPDGEQVSHWLMNHGLDELPRLIDTLQVEAKWRDAVEVLLRQHLGGLVVAH